LNKNEKLLTVIVPIYNSDDNILDFFNTILTLPEEFLSVTKFLFVLDGPQPIIQDNLLKFKTQYSNLEIDHISLLANVGAVKASRIGLRNSKSDYYSIMAIDLQDPPLVLMEMYEVIKESAQHLVIATRSDRGDSAVSKIFSTTAWKFLNSISNYPLPRGGFDFYIIDNYLKDLVLSLKETEFSPIAQLATIGITFERVEYYRPKRKIGKSSWTFRKKLRYFINNIFGLSHLPMKILVLIEIILSISIVLFIISNIISKLLGVSFPNGYLSTLVVILTIGLFQIFSSIILLGYIWRIYDIVANKEIGYVEKT
jgi:glycosyltransferase involved in cell wall biosynthesis